MRPFAVPTTPSRDGHGQEEDAWRGSRGGGVRALCGWDAGWGSGGSDIHRIDAVGTVSEGAASGAKALENGEIPLSTDMYMERS